MGRAEHIRPSSAATWVVCNGNIDMRAMFPLAPEEADTEVTEDGTACHWLASEMWEGRPHAEGTLAPNGRVLFDEMYDAVDTYHGVLRSWPNVVPVCEQSIPIPRILQGMTGTPDAWAYDPDTKTLYIADLKFGYRFVEVFHNLQLICYACGLLDLLQLDWGNTNIVFTIVQPRSYHKSGAVRTWRTTAVNIIQHVSVLAAAASRSDLIYMPNPGCYDCPGRHECTAYQNAALQACEQAYAGDDGVNELSPAALGKELTLLRDAEKKLKGRISGLTTHAEFLARGGTMVPGWVLGATYARETWREGAEVTVMTLAEKYYKTDVRKPARAVTPNQARKLLPASIVAQFAHKPSTGVKLVKQDPYEAEKAFDQ